MPDVGGEEEVAAAGQCFDLLKTIATSKNALEQFYFLQGL